MHECVGLAIIPTDEAEALHRVEEFDRAAGLFAGELTLRTAAVSTARVAVAAVLWNGKRIAFNLEVSRGHTPAAIDESEFKRLSFGEAGEASLLNRRDVYEDIFATIVADDEAETLLAVEEFDDALAFADDLGRHAAAAAAAKAAAATTEAAATAATAAAEAAAVTITAAAAAIATAAESAAITAETTALITEPTAIVVLAETVALVSAAPTALAAASSIKTHAV
jgi:hypothetical protein